MTPHTLYELITAFLTLEAIAAVFLYREHKKQLAEETNRADRWQDRFEAIYQQVLTNDELESLVLSNPKMLDDATEPDVFTANCVLSMTDSTLTITPTKGKVKASQEDE